MKDREVIFKDVLHEHGIKNSFKQPSKEWDAIMEAMDRYANHVYYAGDPMTKDYMEEVHEVITLL